MSVCPDHGQREFIGGRFRCREHHRLGMRDVYRRYRESDLGRARDTRAHWARSLRRTRVRIALKAERIRQLERELEVALRG